MEQGDQDDLELLKDMPGFKGILKVVLKSQMKHLVKQLSKYGDEEAMVLSASISDGSFHHLGSASTNGFLDSHDEIKSQFLGHCLKNDYELQDKAVEKNSSKSAETAQFSDTIMTEKQSESNVHPVAVTRVGDKSQKNSISQDRHIGPLEHVSEHQVKPALVLTRTADKGKPKAAQDRLIGPLVHVPEHKLKSLLPPQVHVEVPADSDLSIGRAGRKRPCETVTFTVTSDELVKHRTVTESASEIPKTASAAAKAKKRRVVNSGNVKFEIEATDLPAAQSIVSYDEGSRNILPLHPDTLGSETSDQSEMVQASKVDLSNSNNDSDTYDSVIVKIEPCDNDDDETAMDNSARGQFETSETETSQLEFKFDSTQADDVDKSDDSVKQSRDDSTVKINKMKTPEKKKRYNAKYQNAWEIIFTWVQKSDKGVNFVFCKVCQRHFSVSHGGKNDVTKHGNSDHHCRKSKLKSASDFVTTKCDQSVIRAETIFSDLVAQHNMPFLVVDHFTKACKTMFPDSKIAQKFSDQNYTK